MTAHPPEPTTTRHVAKEPEFPPPREIDYSCRVPVMFMVCASVLWLLVSLVFGLLASIKMHAPGMLAHSAALTYGRVAAVSSASFIYGFASQAAIAAGLWLFARMGRTFLVMPNGAFIGALVWNFGVLLGVVGIFGGGMMAYPLYEMPPAVSWVFLIAFMLVGLAGILTFVARTERTLYPANWFLFAGFFVFPWTLSVAYLLLGRYNIRPLMQPVIATWFANNFLMLWLAPVALAVIYYFISKLSHQPLRNYPLAVFSFWFYLLFTTASGFQNLPGLPNWMPSLSIVSNTLVLLPAFVIGLTWYQTWAGHLKAQKARDPVSRYIAFAALAFVLTIIFRFCLSWSAVDEAVGLTVFQNGVYTWTVYGFIGMALFAAIHHILPRLYEIEWPSSTMVSAHYGLTVAGIIIVVLAYFLGGYVQGNAINNPSIAFNGPGGVVRQVVPYIGIATGGIFLLLVAQLALFANIVLMLKSIVFRCCGFGTAKEVAR